MCVCAGDSHHLPSSSLHRPAMENTVNAKSLGLNVYPSVLVKEYDGNGDDDDGSGDGDGDGHR